MLCSEITDPKNARVILLAAAGLGLLAVLLAVVTVWWWRRTRGDHPALGPLTTMGEPRWRQADDAQRKRILDAVRPSPDAADQVDVVEAPEPAATGVVAGEPAADAAGLEQSAGDPAG